MAYLSGHHRLIVCADDISSAVDDSLTLADRLLPEVSVAARDRFAQQPYSALLDSSGARSVLGWVQCIRGAQRRPTDSRWRTHADGLIG